MRDVALRSERVDMEKCPASESCFPQLLRFPAVPVGGRNFFKLMQNGEAALLYPGGVREVGLCVTKHHKRSILPKSDAHPLAITLLNVDVCLRASILEVKGRESGGD